MIKWTAYAWWTSQDEHGRDYPVMREFSVVAADDRSAYAEAARLIGRGCDRIEVVEGPRIVRVGRWLVEAAPDQLSPKTGQVKGLTPPSQDGRLGVLAGREGPDLRRDGRPEMDNETCGWCTTEVRYSKLRETSDGANICPDCWSDYRKGA